MARLTDLPAELLVAVFAQLPDLTDVSYLALTNLHLRAVWNEPRHARAIFDSVAPRCIECSPRAQQLLVLQPPSLVEPIDVHEATRRLLVNRHRTELAIEIFEKEEIARLLNSRYRTLEDHGPHLSPTERSRFIQAWYTLWVCLYSRDCQAVLDSVTLRSMHVLWELLLCAFNSGQLPEQLLPYDVDSTRERLIELMPVFQLATEEKAVRLVGAFSGFLRFDDMPSDLYAVLDHFQTYMADIPDVP